MLSGVAELGLGSCLNAVRHLREHRSVLRGPLGSERPAGCCSGGGIIGPRHACGSWASLRLRQPGLQAPVRRLDPLPAPWTEGSPGGLGWGGRTAPYSRFHHASTRVGAPAPSPLNPNRIENNPLWRPLLNNKWFMPVQVGDLFAFHSFLFILIPLPLPQHLPMTKGKEEQGADTC